MSLQSTDQIADLITRIRNAIMVGKNEISVPTSKLKVAISESLKKAGYIADYKVEDAKPRGILHVTINTLAPTHVLLKSKKSANPVVAFIAPLQIFLPSNLVVVSS